VEDGVEGWGLKDQAPGGHRLCSLAAGVSNCV
jgi:hypothetical protein